MTTACNRELNPPGFFKKTTLVFLWCWISLAVTVPLLASTPRDLNPSDPDFPVYPSIKPNVEFWIDIFTRYAKSQGVIHDNRRLDIVYEIVSLDPSQTPAANKTNTEVKAAAIRKYTGILHALAQGSPPASGEQKRVAALFGSRASSSDFKEAALNLRCQTGMKKEFMEGLVRSGGVINEFKRIFRSHGLPVDLVYLPCVESSFDFRAYSRVGAAGVWQFTHATGMEYMNIDYVVDERRDPYISADAAARLLKKNYAHLKEWPMAITAYNHGLNGMLRARNSAGSFEKIIHSYQSPSFKFASRNFYAEFLAARAVAKNPDKYFKNIVLDKPVSFQVIKTKGYLPITQLSETLGLSIEQIQHLNPSLRKPVLNGQKFIPQGFDLRLPKTFALPDTHNLLAKLYQGSQKPSRFHQVQKGETASSIARLHSVTLNELIYANNLNKQAGILIGQNLRIPGKNETRGAKNGAVTPRPQKLPGEKIMANETLTPKNTLQIAVADPIEPLKERALNPYIVTSNLKVLQTHQKEKLTIGTIRVQAEETLGHYADWLKVSTQEILTLNRFKRGASISVDQLLKLPMKNKTIQEFEEKRYEFHKEMEEDFFESFSIQGVDTYEVKTGNTIWSLCSTELEIPFWLLKKYNPEIDFNALVPKQKLTYPIINKPTVE